MSKISVNCPRCHTHYSIDESLVGKRGRCKRCDTSFRVTWMDGVATATNPRHDERRKGPENGVPAEWQPGDVILCVYQVVGEFFKGRMGNALSNPGAGMIQSVLPATVRADHDR